MKVKRLKCKIKVLILTSTFPPQHTGSGLLIDGINKNLELDPSIDFTFKTYCFTSREIPLHASNLTNVTFVRTDREFFNMLKVFKEFIIESFKTDILLVVTLVQPLLIIASFLSFFLRKRIILEHTLLEEDLPGRIRKFYKYITYRFFFRYLKVYSSGLAWQIQKYGFRGKVYNFGAQVDLNRFSYKPDEIISRRETLGIDYKGNNCFTFVGAMSHRKGIDRIVNLLKTFKGTDDYFINLVGPNTDYFDEIYRQNKELLDKLITKGKLNLVLEKSDKVNDYLMSSNFFLFPTRNEGFGAVLIEAMASGCIPVSSRIKGVTDDFLNSGNSFQFDFSEEKFCEIFFKATKMDIIERQKLINQGLRDVTYYSLERISNAYKSMYSEIVNDN